MRLLDGGQIGGGGQVDELLRWVGAFESLHLCFTCDEHTVTI